MPKTYFQHPGLATSLHISDLRGRAPGSQSETGASAGRVHGMQIQRHKAGEEGSDLPSFAGGLLALSQRAHKQKIHKNDTNKNIHF